jgi:hypothetical protein
MARRDISGYGLVGVTVESQAKKELGRGASGDYSAQNRNSSLGAMDMKHEADTAASFIMRSNGKCTWKSSRGVEINCVRPFAFQ